MKIVLGEVYLNRTRLYLTPVVNTFGKTFVGRLNQTTPLAWGLYDVLYLKAKGVSELKHHLFVLQDPKGKYSVQLNRYINEKAGSGIFDTWLKYARGSRYYADDYVFEPLLKNTGRFGHMSLFSIPDKFRKSYDAFLEDRFSRMYEQEELDQVGISKIIKNTGTESVVWKVLTREKTYKKEFIQKVNQLYETSVKDMEVEEFDSLKINPRIEIFNAG